MLRAGGRARTWGPRDAQTPRQSSRNLWASGEPRRAAAGSSPGRWEGSAPPARCRCLVQRSRRTGARAACKGCEAAGALGAAAWARGAGGGPCTPWNLVSPPPGPGSSSFSRRGARARHSPRRAPRLRSCPPPHPARQPARSYQRFPLLLFLLLRPSPPLRTPSPPSTLGAAATAPRAPPRLPPALRSPLAPRSAAAVRISGALFSLKFPICSRSGQREENTQFCLLFQVRSHTLVPTGTLSFCLCLLCMLNLLHCPLLPGNPGGSGRPHLPSPSEK